MKVHLIYGEQLFMNPMLDVELPCLPQIGTTIIFDVDYEDASMEETNEIYNEFMNKVEKIKDCGIEYKVTGISYKLPDTTPFVHLKQV